MRNWRGWLAHTPGFHAELDLKRMDPAFEPASSGELASLLASLCGKPPATVAFGTEAAHLKNSGAETVVFGPGDITVAHQSGEFVPVAELRDCVSYLKTTIQRICGPRVVRRK